MTQPAHSPVEAREPLPDEKTADDHWHRVQALRLQIDNLFREFNSDILHRPSTRTPFDLEPPGFRGLSAVSAPAVDIVEHEDNYVIEVEVPGMDERNIEITLSNDVLSLKGEKHEDAERKDRNHHISERHYGAFERKFRLPCGVDREHISATFTRGLLTLMLPKLPVHQTPAQKIEIKPG